MIKALRNAGVPDLWLEDALQDVRILLWKQPERDDVMVIRSAVVDAARHYGRYSRWGLDRQTLSIETYFTDEQYIDSRGSVLRRSAKPLPSALWAHDDGPQLLDIEAVNREIVKLSPRWRKALANSLNGVHQTNSMECTARQAKLRLRERCA